MLYPKDRLFLREAAGEATSADGTVYELTTLVGSGTPLVRSGKTGKFFALTWADLIAMAVEAGIDEP